jgi:hypothetical protein
MASFSNKQERIELRNNLRVGNEWQLTVAFPKPLSSPVGRNKKRVNIVSQGSVSPIRLLWVCIVIRAILYEIFQRFQTRKWSKLPGQFIKFHTSELTCHRQLSCGTCSDTRGQGSSWADLFLFGYFTTLHQMPRLCSVHRETLDGYEWGALTGSSRGFV